MGCDGKAVSRGISGDFRLSRMITSPQITVLVDEMTVDELRAAIEQIDPAELAALIRKIYAQSGGLQ